jgi:hypothetical protein
MGQMPKIVRSAISARPPDRPICVDRHETAMALRTTP